MPVFSALNPRRALNPRTLNPGTTVLFYKLTVKVDIGIYMTFVVQATTVLAENVLAEKTSLEDKLSKKPDYSIRANFNK